MQKIEYPYISKKEIPADRKSASVQIVFNEEMTLWFDVWFDGDEITGDWNKYIFRTDDAQDMREKAFQDAHNDDVGAYNFADALSLASTVLE